MLPRLVLAFVFAVPPFLFLLASSLEAEQGFTLVVRMVSSASSVLQVFLDTGDGHRTNLPIQTVTRASTVAREYRLPISAGSYRSVRIDPGVGPGTYTIESATVIDPSGRVHTSIPLAELTPLNHVTLVERTSEKVVFDCPPNDHDPQIIYAPARPLRLVQETRTPSALLRWFGLYVAISLVLLWVAELALGRFAQPVSRAWESIAQAGARHPQVAIALVALLATIVAMYPLLFFGRSLVSPNNGGVVLLYDLPPFTPGSSDVEIEDVRGIDVGAAMWAFVPYSSMQRRALAAREWPLWNRYAGPGLSLWGQGQTFLFDPLHWLTLIGPDPAPGWDLKFAAHRFVFAWGVGVAALVALPALVPAAIAASTAPFAGFFAFRLNHPAAFTVTYAPWVLTGWFLLAQAATHRRRAAASIWLTLASALVLLSSPPKEGTMMLLVIEMTGALALLMAVGAGRRLLQHLPYAIAAGVATLLLTTPHWLMFLDTLRASVTQYDIPAAHFASIGILRSMALGPVAEGLSPALHMLSVVLIVASLLSPVRLARSRAMLACGLGASGAIAIACGAIPQSWIVSVPLLANVHSFDATFLTAALVPLLVLSASGAAVLLETSRARIAVVTAGMAAVALSLVSNGVEWIATVGRLQGWLAYCAMIGAVLLPVVLFTARRSFPRLLPVAAAAALAWLLMAPGGQHLETHLPSLDRVLVQPRPRHRLEMTTPSIEAIRAQTEPARAVGLESVLFTGSQALYGLEGIGGPDALFLPQREELTDASRDIARQGWRPIFTASSLVNDASLLDLFNVKYVLAYFNDAPKLGPLVPISEPDLVRAVERPTAWPRAFFVDAVTTYSDAADLVAQLATRRMPMAAIQTSDAFAKEQTRGLPSSGTAFVAAERYTLTANTTGFHIRAPGPGIAVMSETYLPNDFRVTLNGHATAYVRVNHACKGVVIPGAGDWDIRFEYRPARWTIALTGAVIGLLLLCALGLAAALPVAPRRASHQSLPSDEE